MSITVNDQEIDWQKWLELEVTDENDFRDNHLLKQDYHENFDELVNGLYSVTDGFSDYKKEKKFGGYIAAGHQRLYDALNLMSLHYSAGGDNTNLAEIRAWAKKEADTRLALANRVEYANALAKKQFIELDRNKGNETLHSPLKQAMEETPTNIKSVSAEAAFLSTKESQVFNTTGILLMKQCHLTS